MSKGYWYKLIEYGMTDTPIEFYVIGGSRHSCEVLSVVSTFEGTHFEGAKYRSEPSVKCRALGIATCYFSAEAVDISSNSRHLG